MVHQYLLFKQTMFFFGKSKVCPMTQFTGAADNSSDFDGYTLLLEFENKKHMYFWIRNF